VTCEVVSQRIKEERSLRNIFPGLVYFVWGGFENRNGFIGRIIVDFSRETANRVLGQDSICIQVQSSGTAPGTGRVIQEVDRQLLVSLMKIPRTRFFS